MDSSFLLRVFLFLYMRLKTIFDNSNVYFIFESMKIITVQNIEYETVHRGKINSMKLRKNTQNIKTHTSIFQVSILSKSYPSFTLTNFSNVLNILNHDYSHKFIYELVTYTIRTNVRRDSFLKERQLEEKKEETCLLDLT